jgi:serine/threonine protein kinase
VALAAGTRFGPSEVVAPFGEGGMGQVYRATDTNLKPNIAIKVLPDAVATDAERLGRFQPKRASTPGSIIRTSRGSIGSD